MNGFVYKLPPANVPEVKCENKDLQGYLELEVSLINFITSTNKNLGKVLDNKKIENKQLHEKELINKINDTPLKHINHNNKNSASVNEISKELKKIVSSIQNDEVHETEKGNCNTADSVQVKIIWCGERKEDAANISISCKTQQTKKKYNQHLNRQQQYDQKHKQVKRQHLQLSANNKLRYRICTSGALFLEYLRSCKPIEIIVTNTTSDSCLTTSKPLGKAQLRLPLILLKKFNHNIVKGQNFEYKTKVYTLYQTNQKQETVEKSLIKSGEIQLRFKMLFAPTAVASAAAVAASQHTNVVILDKHHHHLNNHCHRHHHNHRHHHHLGGNVNKVSEDVQGDIPKRLTSQTKSEEIVEAMKKLDAKLVAYLAGETEISTKLSNCEEKNELNLNLENNIKNVSNNLEDLLPATKFNIFKSIKSIKLEMEALTLQPEGTKCMQLLENEIGPIFTVECQLSNELIKLVPRHDMFHIMQFESEKFQSLTQCTRFGQEAERAVKLDLNEVLNDENANETEQDFGRIHFNVWWREPGDYLNEVLGMGVLELKDLYDASLLEQCKRINIQRCGEDLACLYFKIRLQREDVVDKSSNIQMKRELLLPKQISSDSDSEKTPATDKNKTSTTGQQQTAAAAAAQTNIVAANISTSNIDKGEYAENFLYLKHTKLQ